LESLNKDGSEEINYYNNSKKIDINITIVPRGWNAYRNIYTLISIEYLYENITTDECIKAHEKNECEKGNPDWIWGNITDFHSYEFQNCINECYERYYPEPINTSLEDYYRKYCYENCKNEKICRKKTIHDLSCEQLLKKLLLHDLISLCGEELFSNGFCWRGTALTEEQAYNLANEKGCFNLSK